MNAAPPYTTQEIVVETRQDCPPPDELLNLNRPPNELYKDVQAKCLLLHQSPVAVVQRLTLRREKSERKLPTCSDQGLRERKVSATLKWQQHNLGVGMPLCTGDVLVTWRGLEVSYLTFKPEKGASGKPNGKMTFGEPGTLSGMGRLIFEDNRESTLMSGRLDYFFDPDYPEKRIVLGMKGFGAGGAGTYVSMEVTDGCRSEGLVLVPTQDPGAKGETHQVKLCREERSGVSVCDVTVGEGQSRSIQGELPTTLESQDAISALQVASRVSYEEQKTLLKEAGIKVPIKDNDYVAPPAPGKLKLRVEPKDSPVWLDGRRVTLKNGTLEQALTPGPHLVLAEGADGTRKEQALEVVPSREYPVTLELLPVAAGIAGITWVSIPGTGPEGFWMGSPEGEGDEDEYPRHKVTVPAFQMSKTEVTVAQYRACVKANWKGCTEEGLTLNDTCNYDKPNRDNHPVNCVDWQQAKAFAAWVAQSTPGVRLPSESEWEYAARGKEGRKYPWGNKPEPSCDNAVMDGCPGETQPVCSKTDGNTSTGLCDMVGNVWEWVEDCYEDNYKDALIDGGARTVCYGSDRVLRGGSWGNEASELRGASRVRGWPSDRHASVGFRVVWPASRGAAP